MSSHSSIDQFPKSVPMAAFLLLILVFGFPVPSAAEDKSPMIAVTPLQAQGVTESDAAVLTESLSDEMLQSGSVRVMERSQMDKILMEQGFQQATCDTSECALQMGRLLGIERILVGTVGKIGGTYSVSVRMVDVRTGEIISSSRRNARGAIDDVLVTLMPQLARDLAQKQSAGSEGADSSVEESGSSSVLWWTLGGVAVLGGGAAAALLLMADDKTSSNTPDPVKGSGMVDVQVVAP